MNWVHPTALLIGTWVLVFLQSWCTGLRLWIHAQPELLSGMVVYSALFASLPTTVAVALLAGLGSDSLSSGPFGLGAVPLLLLGVLLHRRRDVILRDSRWAQASIGGVAGLCVALGSFVLLFLFWPLVSSGSAAASAPFTPEVRMGLGDLPVAGVGRLWQWFVAGVTGAVVTPLIFRVFRWVDATCNYQVAPSLIRSGDREIDRGRF